jgi:hypothetical protein
MQTHEDTNAWCLRCEWELSMTIAWLAMLALVAPAPWSDGRSQGEDLLIHVITFGPGDVIPEMFGHNAIVVEDTRLHEERMYNYGEYRFASNLLPNYLRGELDFYVGERPVAPTIRIYREKNRSVHSQTLALSPAQKLRLAKLLADNILEENRSYRYDHYLDNCATRIRDILDKATDGQVSASAKAAPARTTLREHTRAMTAVNFPVGLIIDAFTNDEVDQPGSRWSEAFLPREFAELLRELTVTDETGASRPMVAAEATLFEAARPASAPTSVWWSLALGVVAGAVVFGAGRSRRGAAMMSIMAGIVVGIPGTVLTLLATMTTHHVTFHNANLLWANPLALSLVFFGVLQLPSKARLARAWRMICINLAGAVAVALVASFFIGQVTSWPLALCAPPLLVLGVCAWRMRVPAR